MNLKLILPNKTVPVEALAQNGRLTITSAGGIWFQLEGLTLDHLRYGGEPGIIRAKRSAPARHFTERGLNLSDLDPALGPATLKAMLIEHFSLIGMSEMVEALMMDYKAVTGKAYKSEGNDHQPDPQLAEDLALVEPLRDELLDDEGKLVWGGQSRIAEALGVDNGGAYRKRILAVAEMLTKEAA